MSDIGGARRAQSGHWSQGHTDHHCPWQGIISRVEGKKEEESDEEKNSNPMAHWGEKVPHMLPQVLEHKNDKAQIG
jgi:hypothetical protein